MKKIFLMLLTIIIISCENGVSVYELVNSDRYNEKTVQIYGTVKNSVFILDKGFFILGDESGAEIAVLPLTTYPSKGANVSIKGRVKILFILDKANFKFIEEIK